MVKTSYISCACNRLPHVVDWGQNNLICYAANHAIAIYDPNNKQFGSVLSTLHAHTSRVNVVRWIRHRMFPEPETELVSASSDGTAIIWQANDLAAGDFKAKDVIKVNEPLNICEAAYIFAGSSDLLICTGSTTGDFKLWLRLNDKKAELFQTINFSKKLPIEARIGLLPTQHENSANVLLLIALEDSTIQLYSTFATGNTNQNKIDSFVKVQTLVGHEDWVTCIDFALRDSQNLLIATSSQDTTIRLWKISQITNKGIENSKESQKLKPKKQCFSTNNEEYEIILESILIGHDAWVYEVHWHPPIKVDGKHIQPIQLLSSSLDKTAIIWKPSDNAGIWSEAVRVGEVGGNSLGFYGGKFGPSGQNILTHDYHGSFHMWVYQEKLEKWVPRPAPSGHYDSVVDLCWDPKGRFLLTSSEDQTTRVHVSWPMENGEESWHEINRPQIHGYNMSCLAILKPYVFASGAEEKVVRVFTAPLNFKKYLESLKYDTSDFNSKAMAEAASVPALGLTNKALFDSDVSEEPDMIDISKQLNFEEPPLEEELVRQTLWPEFQKLYGHGYEIFSMAARHDGTLLATSSKSASPEHAAIILWDTRTWSQVQKLSSHQLTVTQLAFSPDDKYLLSVSRDRRWSLYIHQDHKYKLLVSSPQKGSLHTRIIWTCTWTSDSKYFATGSRDGKIGIWNKNIDDNNIPQPVTYLHLNDSSVTALAFAPLSEQNKFIYILAIGLENGCIDIRKIEQVSESYSYEWKQLTFLDTSKAHHSTVKRLSFRPICNNQKNIMQLASCGLDCVVKLHDISFN